MSRTDSLEKIRTQLLKRREALQQALQGDLRLLQETSQGQTSDVLDAAAESISDELSSQLIEAESRELRQIQQAIERWEDGSFGICKQCSKNIPLTRLRAVPYATDCIGCRRKSERHGSAAVTWNRVYDTPGEVDVA